MTEHEKPAERALDGISEAVRLAVEQPNNNPSRRSQQESARAAEIASSRHHLVGRRCGGGLARSELALAEHYGRIARLQFGRKRHA